MRRKAQPKTPAEAMSRAMTEAQTEYWFPADSEEVRKVLLVLAANGWELVLIERPSENRKPAP